MPLPISPYAYSTSSLCPNAKLKIFGYVHRQRERASQKNFKLKLPLSHQPVFGRGFCDNCIHQSPLTGTPEHPKACSEPTWFKFSLFFHRSAVFVSVPVWSRSIFCFDFEKPICMFVERTSFWTAIWCSTLFSDLGEKRSLAWSGPFFLDQI